MITTIVAVYLAFLFSYAHVLFLMENDGLSALDALSQLPDDILNHPFDFVPNGNNPSLTAAAFWGKYFKTTLLITLAAGIAGFIVYSNYRMKKHYNNEKVMGDAQWLKDYVEYNKKFTDPIGSPKNDGPNNMILTKRISMSLNGWEIRRNCNVFVVGGSGAGKSFNLVGPNIMNANCSFVVTDPSGGLYREYGRFLEYKGYNVKCFNLEHMDLSSKYNPFNYVHSDKDVEVLVTTLLENTTPPDKKGGDDFWEKAESQLLTALVSYLHNYVSKETQSFSNVMRMLLAAEVDENDSSAKSPLDCMFDEIREQDPDSFALKQYDSFKKGAGKTLKSILISCGVRLRSFNLPDVMRLTNTDNIELDRVGDEKTALFIIIPTGETTYNFLASLMYSQLFQRLYDYSQNTAAYSQLIVDSDKQVWRTFRAEDPMDADRVAKQAQEFYDKAVNAKIVHNPDYNWYEMQTEDGELVGYRGSEAEAQKALEKLRKGGVMPNSKQSNRGQRLPIHTRLLLDEFANIGRIPQFSEKVATIRKYEISTTIIVQSLQQMKNLYKDDWETLTGNCDNTLYLGGGADTVTAEWISKLIGKETRFVQGENFSRQGGGTSINRQGVELIAPSQLRTLDENQCILLSKSLDPVLDDKYPATSHPNRKLVEELVKQYGSYNFNAQKAQDLYDAHHSVMGALSDKHGEVIEAENTQALIEQVEAQIAEEFENNQDADGNAIIGEVVSINSIREAIEETVPLQTKDDAGESMAKLMEQNNYLWGPDEIIFSSVPASESI